MCVCVCVCEYAQKKKKKKKNNNQKQKGHQLTILLIVELFTNVEHIGLFLTKRLQGVWICNVVTVI